ncbi:hypothetical protein KP509_23G028500 [Ceratopteris richardii]|uniref:Uncharacterized protein n=1 Tax=Ceratopteris richardii TaxID=49495 RepID=A0A8T2RYG5_CERRI|nr:hypothetical protein KP509_23G028500 [Ceratopteris richardii]
MGRQLGIELSSWSLRPGVSLALGGVLVVIIIMAVTAIFLIFYYWALLARKAMSDTTAPMDASQSDFTASVATENPVQGVAPRYAIFMKLEPALACPPSTVVLMPGEEMPTFLAIPCQHYLPGGRNETDNRSIPNPEV